MYDNLEIPQIGEKRMTFLFLETVLTFTKLQHQEKLFNLQKLHVIRAQNPPVSTTSFISLLTSHYTEPRNMEGKLN